MDDMISRQAALEALFELYEYQRAIDPTEAADLVRQGIYLACKKIEQLPPVQHWTLCSDHLPDYGEEVMTVSDDDEYLVNRIIDDVYGEWLYDGAIAWAQLQNSRGDEWSGHIAVTISRRKMVDIS